MVSFVRLSSVSLPENGVLTFLALWERPFNDLNTLNCDIQLSSVNHFESKNHKEVTISPRDLRGLESQTH